MSSDGNPLDLIVVGGGVAGLCTAYLAASSGLNTALIEANNWVGGRVGLTSSAVSTGAEFVHGSGGKIWDLISEFGLETYPYPGGEGLSRYVDESCSEIAGMAARVSAIVDRAYSSVDDPRTVAEFFSDPEFEGSDSARFALERICRVEGCDPKRCVISSLSEQSSRKTGDELNYRIVGGYGQLIKKLSDANFKLYLGMPVIRIEQKPSLCKITCNGGECFYSRYVTVATPLSSLRSSSISIEPKPTRQFSQALSNINLGHAMKIIAEVEGDLDFPENYIFSHHLIHSIWKNTEGEQHYLIGFVGGIPYVDKLTTLSGGIPSSFRRIVKSLFGDIILRKIYWKTWSEAKWIEYSYAYPGSQGIGAQEALINSGYERIFFAGEGTAIDGDIGTVSGAVSSAYRAFSQICDIDLGAQS